MEVVFRNIPNSSFFLFSIDYLVFCLESVNGLSSDFRLEKSSALRTEFRGYSNAEPIYNKLFYAMPCTKRKHKPIFFSFASLFPHSIQGRDPVFPKQGKFPTTR